MSLSTLELEELLRLALAALRVRADASPESGFALPAVLQTTPQRTLREWLDEHERLIGEQGYKPQTIVNRTAVIRHVRNLWGAVPIMLLKPHMIATSVRELAVTHSSTAQRVLTELRAAYTEAIANGWADKNPAIGVKMPKHKVIRARLRFETWRAMVALAKKGPQRWVVCLLFLALLTGQRRADLAKMCFDDVVDGHLRIEQQKEAGRGYGARVEIPLALRMEAVNTSLGQVITHCARSAKPGPTLIRSAGGKPIEVSSLSARFHQFIVAVLGKGAHARYERPSLHEVRSLPARLYFAQGVDVQTLLGHSSAEMTEVYKNDRGLSAKEYKRVVVTA